MLQTIVTTFLWSNIYSILYLVFLKYRYGCIITENYVYIAEDACFKKVKKEDIEISQVDGLLKVEILKNKKTYVFSKKINVLYSI